MSYLAILGRQSILSLAELEAVTGADAITPIDSHALLAVKPDLAKLGGVIKLAQVVYDDPNLDLEAIALQLPGGSEKLNLGLSLYGKFTPADPIRLGMELKKRLRTSRSVRLVLPKRPSLALTAAQLKFNHLDTSNPELIILATKDRTIAAVTTSYQDVDAYSQRDYGRPSRDARVGMLPPKLAQILINLSGTSQGLVYDPFCGTGVVLQEARLMGRPILGSDIDAKMVRAAQDNMQWLSGQSKQLPEWQVVQANATNVAMPPDVTTIVSEGYLGPAFSGSPSTKQLDDADAEISQLTTRFLKHLATSTPAELPVVLCLPAWQAGQRLPGVVDQISRLGYTTRQFVHAPYPLIYQRPGQTVGRLILVMKRSWPTQKPVDQLN